MKRNIRRENERMKEREATSERAAQRKRGIETVKEKKVRCHEREKINKKNRHKKRQLIVNPRLLLRRCLSSAPSSDDSLITDLISNRIYFLPYSRTIKRLIHDRLFHYSNISGRHFLPKQHLDQQYRLPSKSLFSIKQLSERIDWNLAGIREKAAIKRRHCNR